jgi:hypothetical protein
MAVIVIGQERVRDSPDRVKRRQPLEQSYKHFLLGVAEWPVSFRRPLSSTERRQNRLTMTGDDYG